MDSNSEKDVVYFARTDFRNSKRLFGIKRKDRRQHTYVIGKTGTGKSVLLNNMIVQDIANGEGLCVVDPHGELIEGVLKKIPEERMKDVIYFNPADTDFHIGFNVLELPDPKYKHLVASGLMAIFTKIWAGVWSPRMEYILNNCILALLDTPGSTLLGIPRLLTDREYRQRVISNVTDPVVKAFWINEFEAWQDKFRNEAIAPIQNKVGQFLSTALIRNIVGQSKSTVDIFNVMNEGKILLVNVSKGRIGEDNSALLGAMLITKIQLAAMERVRIPEDERVDFYLYVDEFQNFATDSFAGILSESRKYRLDLILAHQYVGQLVNDKSTKVRDAIFGNVGTMVVFRVGAADAEFLENEFTPEFTIEDIVNIPNYHIYIKLMVDGVTTRPFSAHTIPPLNVKVSETVEEDVIKMSQQMYAKSREYVESEINRWSGVMDNATGLVGGAPAQRSFASVGASASANSSNASDRNRMGANGPRYEAVCSSCGKTTTLPFEPTPGRPVYCRECLKKIESGEMQPIRMPRTPAKKAAPQRGYSDALGNLGIEFAASGADTGGNSAAELIEKSHEHDYQPIAEIPDSMPAESLNPQKNSQKKERGPIRTWRSNERERSAPATPAGIPAPSRAATAAGAPGESTEPQPTLSLSSLKAPIEHTPRTKRAPREKEEISISDLRNAIKASLNASLANGGGDDDKEIADPAVAAAPEQSTNYYTDPTAESEPASQEQEQPQRQQEEDDDEDEDMHRR